jgi:hypothetical protein
LPVEGTTGQHNNSSVSARIIVVAPREPRIYGLFFGTEPAAEDEHEPYRDLVLACAELGYSVEPAADQELTECRHVIFWNAENMSDGIGLRGVTRRAARKAFGRAREPLPRDWPVEAVRLGLRERLVLLAFEPNVVCPDNYWPSMHRQVGRVLTFDDDLVDGRRFRKFHVPLPLTAPPVQPPPFAERRLLTHVSAGAKTSRRRGELYTERRRAVAAAERLCPGQFDLYGWGWDRAPGGPPASWRGPVEHTWQVLQLYRFALCFENNRNHRGYVSEKLMECLRSGSVPVYLGAPNVTDYVDEGAFIDMRRFDSYEALVEHLRGVDAVQHAAMVEAGRRYLASERFRPFTAPAFVEQVLAALDLGPAGGGSAAPGSTSAAPGGSAASPGGSAAPGAVTRP